MIKKSIYVILIVSLLTTSSCLSAMSQKVADKPSVDELRTIQTRTYEKANTNNVMKAVLNVLQDAYYFVNQADSKIGFIQASREFDTKDKSINIKKEFGCSTKFAVIKKFIPFSPSYVKTEADINVTTNSDKTTVRISFRKKIFNLYDSTIKITEVTDNNQYDNFYSDLDKELQIKSNK